MEMSLLSDNKLRISLTKNDISVLGLKNGMYDGEYIKNSTAFLGLLESARIKTGFDASDGVISVSIYKNADGGCDMYITRTGKSKPKSKDVEKTQNVILRFDKESDMSRACYAMYSQGFTNDAGAYYEKTNSGYRYYLIINKKQAIYPVCIAIEFSSDGEFLPVDVFLPYILEHCRVICEKNAVSVLAKTVGSVVK